MAETLIRLSAEFSTMSEEMAGIEMRRPVKWSEIRAVEKTDKSADNAYDATEDGQRRIYLKRIMDASTRKQSALKNMLRVMENESRGAY